MNNSTDLFDQLEEIIKNGDEAQARAFLVDHLQEFPEDAREKIMFAFFAEALGQEAAATGLQQSGGDALELLMEAKDKLENVQKSSETN